MLPFRGLGQPMAVHGLFGGSAMARKLVTRKELKLIYGIPYSNTHLKRLERLGSFPKRVQLSPARVGWYEDEIWAWVDSRPRA